MFCLTSHLRSLTNVVQAGRHPIVLLTGAACYKYVLGFIGDISIRIAHFKEKKLDQIYLF